MNLSDSLSSPAGHTLHIRLFSGLVLSLGDRPLPAIVTRPARSLFAMENRGG
ncbi:MAG TPA: hypothetical protein G4O02_09680 [Caldilineae bacterium]|nr:hypothetical protein [Caldilineae bacterium]